LRFRRGGCDDKVQFDIAETNSESPPLGLPFPLVVLLKKGDKEIHGLSWRILRFIEIRDGDDIDIRLRIACWPNGSGASIAALQEGIDNDIFERLVIMKPLPKRLVAHLTFIPLVLGWADALQVLVEIRWQY